MLCAANTIGEEQQQKYSSTRFLASSIVDWQLKRFPTAGYSFPLEKNDGQYSVQQEQQHRGIVVVRMRTVTRVAKSSLCISLSLCLCSSGSSRFNCLCLSQCPLVGHSSIHFCNDLIRVLETRFVNTKHTPVGTTSKKTGCLQQLEANKQTLK